MSADHLYHRSLNVNLVFPNEEEYPYVELAIEAPNQVVAEVRREPGDGYCLQLFEVSPVHGGRWCFSAADFIEAVQQAIAEIERG